MPEIRYGDHLMHEVENVAWAGTLSGTRRGFVVGLAVGLVFAAAVVGALYATGKYASPARVEASRPDVADPREADGPGAEAETLRDENRLLKKQLERALAGAKVSPPEPRPTTARDPSGARAAAPPPQRTLHGAPTAAALPKAGVAALAGPATSRAPSSTHEAEPPREALALAPPPVARAATAPPSPALGMAIAEVRTSQGDAVSGVPIAFRFVGEGNRQIAGTTVPTNRAGRSAATIPAGTACAEYRLPEEYLRAGRVKPPISPATGLPLAAGVFRTCGEVLAHPNGIIGVFTID
jgi:hypothetical protein